MSSNVNNNQKQNNTTNTQHVSETPRWEFEVQQLEKHQKEWGKSSWKIVKLIGASQRFFSGFYLSYLSFKNSIQYGANAAWKILTVAFHRDSKAIGGAIDKSFFCLLEAVYAPWWVAYNSSGLIAKHNTKFPESWKVAKDAYDSLVTEKNNLISAGQNKDSEIQNKTNEINTKAQEIITKNNEINLKNIEIQNLKNSKGGGITEEDAKKLKNENTDLKNKIIKFENNEIALNLDKTQLELDKTILKNQLTNQKNNYENIIEKLKKENQELEEKLKNSTEKNLNPKKGTVYMPVDNKTNLNAVKRNYLSELYYGKMTEEEVDNYYFAEQKKAIQKTEGFVESDPSSDKSANEITNRIKKAKVAKDDGKNMNFTNDNLKTCKTPPNYYWHDSFIYENKGDQDKNIEKILDFAKDASTKNSDNITNNKQICKIIKTFINQDLIRSDEAKKWIETRLNDKGDPNFQLKLSKTSLDQPVDIYFTNREKQAGYLQIQQRLLVELELNGEPTGLFAELSVSRAINLQNNQEIKDCNLFLSEFAPKGHFNITKQVEGLEHQKYEIAVKSITNALESDETFIDLKEYKKLIKIEKDFSIEKVYKHYETKSNNSILSELEKKILPVIKALTERPKNDSEWLGIKVKFIWELRKLLDSKEFQNQLDKKIAKEEYDLNIDLILNIVLYRFLNKEMQTNNERNIKKIHDISTKLTGKSINKDSTIEEQLESIETVLSSPITMTNAISSVLSKTYGYDPQNDDNDPYINYHLEIGGKEILSLRASSPTTDGLNSSSVNIEYLTFVTIYTKILGKKIAYFNLQDNEGKWYYPLKKEKGRFQAISQISEENDKFYHFGIPQDNGYYKRSNQAPMKSTAFKGESALALKEGYTFPPNFLDNGVKNQICDLSKNKLADEIKDDDIFNDVIRILHKEEVPETLEIEQQEAFVDIFNGFLKLFELKQSGADLEQIACKEAADRAGKEHAIRNLIIIILLGKEKDEAVMQDWETITFGPCVNIKGRTMVPDRKERLVQAKNTLLSKEVKQVLQKHSKAFCEKYGITKKSLAMLPQNYKIKSKTDVDDIDDFLDEFKTKKKENKNLEPTKNNPLKIKCLKDMNESFVLSVYKGDKGKSKNSGNYEIRGIERSKDNKEIWLYLYWENIKEVNTINFKLTEDSTDPLFTNLIERNSEATEYNPLKIKKVKNKNGDEKKLIRYIGEELVDSKSKETYKIEKIERSKDKKEVHVYSKKDGDMISRVDTYHVLEIDKSQEELFNNLKEKTN